MAKETQYASKGGCRTPEGDPGPGRPVNGIRERTGEYGSPQDPSEEEEDSRQIRSMKCRIPVGARRRLAPNK